MSGGVQGQFEAWTIQAGEALTDLKAGTGHLYKAVRNKTGSFASNGQEAVGLLQYGADEDGYASIAVSGVSKFVAADTISSADMLLTVTTSGYMKVAVSGDWIVGRNLYSVTSGGVVAGLFNFATPAYYNPTEAVSA